MYLLELTTMPTTSTQKIDRGIRDSFHTIIEPSFGNLLPQFLDPDYDKRQEILQTLRAEKAEVLKALEQEISRQMLKIFLEENENDIIYLDMSQKPDQENVMLFFLKKVGEAYNISEEEMLAKMKERPLYPIKQQFNTFMEYQTELEKLIAERKPESDMKALSDSIDTYNELLRNFLEQNKQAPDEKAGVDTEELLDSIDEHKKILEEYIKKSKERSDKNANIEAIRNTKGYILANE